VSNWIFYTEIHTEPICSELLPLTSKHRLRNDDNNNNSYNSLQIINQNNDSITILTPYNSVAYDELNNTYQFIGPYNLSCKDYIDFNYTDRIELWHNNKCCKDINFDSGREHTKDTPELILGGNDFKQKVHCFTCYDRCAARYKCHRHKVSMQN
jgi:hypothetical protein